MFKHCVVCSLVLLVFGCSKKTDDDVAVIVNGYSIRKTAIREAAEMLRESIIAEQPEKAVEGVTNELLAGAAQQLVANRLLLEQADKKGIVASNAAVDSAGDLLKKRFPDSASFAQQLTAMGETDSSFRVRIAEGIRLNTLLADIIDNCRKIDSSECRAFYDKNTDLYKGKARMRVSQIFLPFSNDTSELEKAKLFEKATKIRGEILSGKSFGECARNYSTGPGTHDDGDIGWFSIGDLRQDLETPLLQLEKGAVSPVVTTTIGLHIVKKTDEETESVQPFESIENRVRFVLEMKERNLTVNRYIDSLMSKAKILYIDTTLKNSPPHTVNLVN